MIFFIIGVIVGCALMWTFAVLLAEHDDEEDEQDDQR